MSWVWPEYRTNDMDAVEDILSAGHEWSFDALAKATGLGTWELTAALAQSTAQEAVTSRVDLSTGRHVRLYRASN